MTQRQQFWKRLAQAARQVPLEPFAEAPFGFANRVVTRWCAGERPLPSPWEFFSLRSVAFALLVMLVCLSTNYNVVREQFISDPAAPADLATLIAEP